MVKEKKSKPNWNPLVPTLCAYCWKNKIKSEACLVWGIDRVCADCFKKKLEEYNKLKEKEKNGSN